MQEKTPTVKDLRWDDPQQIQPLRPDKKSCSFLHKSFRYFKRIIADLCNKSIAMMIAQIAKPGQHDR